MLKRGGYEIKILNTIDFNKSMHYNPFKYIHSEKDILKLVNTLIANTKYFARGDIVDCIAEYPKDPSLPKWIREKNQFEDLEAAIRLLQRSGRR
jgi:hypothetical protein